MSMHRRLAATVYTTLLVTAPAAWEGAVAQDSDAEPGAVDAAVTRSIPRGPDDVAARIESDSRPREATFDLPGVDRFLQPWTDWKDRVAADHGFRLGLDYQAVQQWSDNTEGEDNAAGGIFRAFASWDVWGRENGTRTGTIDVRYEHRHKINTALPPESLAPSFGWAGTTAPDWSDQGSGLTVLTLRQRLDVGDSPIELRVGRQSPFAQFDITPYSDNLTGFQNNSIILNPTIGYPSAGSFGIGGYLGLPRSKFYALGMILDANGSYDDLGLDTLDEGEYFSALEFGWTDQDQTGALYLFDNVHFGLWHNDRSGEGLVMTGSYHFQAQNMGVFARLGYTSDDSTTIYRKYAAAGLEKGLFHASSFGIGASWGEPSGSDVEQVATEVFYRWQLSRNFALTPSIQWLFDPVGNEVDDRVTVYGLRARLTL